MSNITHLYNAGDTLYCYDNQGGLDGIYRVLCTQVEIDTYSDEPVIQYYVLIPELKATRLKPESELFPTYEQLLNYLYPTTPGLTPSATPTPSSQPTVEPTPTPTPSESPQPSVEITPTPSGTFEIFPTPSVDITVTPMETPLTSVEPNPTPTPSVEVTLTPSETPQPSVQPTPTPSATPSGAEGDILNAIT